MKTTATVAILLTLCSLVAALILDNPWLAWMCGWGGATLTCIWLIGRSVSAISETEA